MPLSEHEQQILSEMEEQLYETDPALVREVSSTTVYTNGVRSLKWSVFLFFVGLVAMCALLSTSFVLAFGGFVVMLGSALWAERSARHLGQVGWDQLTQSLRVDGFREFLGTPSQRMKERFGRPDEDDPQE